MTATIDNGLKALVIDDSSTDAQTLTYLLTKRLRCQVETVSDGLEGLDRLSASRYDAVFLDLQMPVMSGVEVLREIRAAPSTMDLPVFILTSNADPQTIRALLELKIYDYVVKPYNADSLVRRFTEKFKPLLSRTALPAEMALPGAEQMRDPAKQVLLIADEDGNFRHFFTSLLGTDYHIIEAPNGAQALALALQYSPNFVFASNKLGVFKRDRLVAKLRQSPALRELKVFAVAADSDSAPLDAKLYDGQVRRTFLAAPFKEAVEQLLGGFVDGSQAAKPTAESKLLAALTSATEQVFGMMMSSEIAVLEAAPPAAAATAMTVGSIELYGYAEKKLLTVVFSCAQISVIAMATRMLMMDEAEAAQNLELAKSTLAETLNMVGGRINQSLEEESRSFLLSLPRVEERNGGEDLKLGVSLCRAHFAAGERIQFAVEIVSRDLTVSKIASGQLAKGMALAAPIELDANRRWEVGTLLSDEMIAELRTAAAGDTAVFQSA